MAILAVLHDSANALKTEFTEAMLKERRSRPPRERGSIGVRVRQTATSGPGIFQIEWYRVQGKQRTKYLKRGKDKDGRISQHYRLGAFGRLTDWEKALILKYEPQFAKLRTIQSHIGHIRLRSYLIDQVLQRKDTLMNASESLNDLVEWNE
ncbi:conjugative transfer protein MobI(A/C) [Thiocystis minor]|uniref:conjugative transfer protein MobI(A/C) n=1 Tax=Thiocystis minor TaxID=61597 RepID=UPI001911BC0F|nr:conjugative transfer protein MobI(A/C) [Thiocystis minor]